MSFEGYSEKNLDRLIKDEEKNQDGKEKKKEGDKEDSNNKKTLELWKSKKEDIENKKTLEGLMGKVWEINKDALKVSPETKWEIETETKKFKEDLNKIENEFGTWKLTPELDKQKDEKKQKLVESYLSSVKSLVWTKEASQAEQTKQYRDQLNTQGEHYTRLLDSFHDTLKKWWEEHDKKRVEKWIKNSKEAHEQWTQESQKSQEEAKKDVDRKIAEAIWEGWKK